ncbi:hypothetical protein QBC44DRAFT_313224, partial [Cladorrhinum sp. PSN332]
IILIMVTAYRLALVLAPPPISYAPKSPPLNCIFALRKVDQEGVEIARTSLNFGGIDTAVVRLDVDAGLLPKSLLLVLESNSFMAVRMAGLLVNTNTIFLPVSVIRILESIPALAND